MSSAFLKNETADAPVVIPARAPLPPATPNYVTSQGLNLLRTELIDLENQRAQHQATQVDDQNEHSRQLALLNGCIAQLSQRIATAKVVDTKEQDRVRFGATVGLTIQSGPSAGTERQFTIVGVDQAKATQGLIAFTAPLALVLQGKRIGETVVLPGPQGQQAMKVRSIHYEMTS